MRWPSTTEVLRDAGLYRIYRENARAELNKARGSFVNRACNWLALGKEPDMSLMADAELAPMLKGYIDGYRRFLDEHQIELVTWELTRKCDFERFVSHPDQEMARLECLPRCKHRALHSSRLTANPAANVQIKTGTAPKWVPLQTAGEVLAIGDITMQRFALLLPGDGSYDLMPHRSHRDIDEFRILVRAWWVKQKYAEPEQGTGDDDKS
jgi:hypothetical protein